MIRAALLACVLWLAAWPAAAQISFVSAGNSNTTSVTLGTHQAGDEICIFAYNSANNTIPVAPGDYQTLNHISVFGGNNAMRLGCKIASGSSEVSGTWSSATRMVALVYRGADNLAGGGCALADTGTTTITWDHDCYAALQNTSGSSWLVGCAGMNASEDLDTNVPAGLTFRAGAINTTGTGEMACHDTTTGITSFTDTTTTGHASGKFAMMMIEIRASAAVSRAGRMLRLGVH